MCCGFSEVNDFTTLMISIIIVIVIAILKPCADLFPRLAFTMITKWIKNREIWNSVIRGFIKLIEKNCVRKGYSKIQRTKTTGLRQNTSIGSPVLTSNKRSLTLSSMLVFWCWSCTNYQHSNSTFSLIKTSEEKQGTHKDGFFAHPVEFDSLFFSGYLPSLLFHHVNHNYRKINRGPWLCSSKRHSV